MIKKTRTDNRDCSSFRDPNGFVFYKDGRVYRQINKSYEKNFDLFNKSGLYQELTNNNLILGYKTCLKNTGLSAVAYRVVETETIPFISYPYEWCFSQLKDAALLTLLIQKKSLEHNLSLKDASAYNIQFLNGKPIHIDLLSYEEYVEGNPWIAYRQFCQHFLAPLLLMSYVDVRLSQLLRIYIDGIPLDLASKLLPKTSFFNFPILSHIHLQAKNQLELGDLNKTDLTNNYPKKIKLSKYALLAIVDNLESVIKNLKLKKTKTEWGEYYSFTNYAKKSFEQKKDLVKKYIETVKPKIVWDLGANTGEFSRITGDKNILTVSFDVDYLAVEKNYLKVKENNETRILPLILDLVNPTPAIGWLNQERKSIINRGPCDLVMALALIHHLAISNNIPLEYIADFFSKIGRYLMIEFIPKEDSQMKKLLSRREDIFSKYDQLNFEKVFLNHFKIISSHKIINSERTLYLMKKIHD